MAIATTPRPAAPLRTQLPLLALVWLSMLVSPLVARDSVRPEAAHAAHAAAVQTSAAASALVAPAANIDIDASPNRELVGAVGAALLPAPAIPAALVATAREDLTGSSAERDRAQSTQPPEPATASAPIAAAVVMPPPLESASATSVVTSAVIATVPFPPAPGLTGREQRLLEAMNAQRAAAGVPPLLASPTLTQAARSRSQDMAINGYFAHIGPHGQSWYTALAAVGWTMSGGGENLAKVAGDEPTAVAVAVDRLMASPTHRANIVSQAFRLVGIGAVVDAAGSTIFTTIFTDR
jgi:uncharacterized protein YkwD